MPITASSLATTMSPHSARSLPPPTHQPCTCTTTGFSVRHRLMNFGMGPVAGWLDHLKSLPGSQRPSVSIHSDQCSNPPPKSKPPQNERPAPRRTMTFTSSSRVASSTAASSSSGIGGTMVFRRSGRLRVIVATGPSTE